MKNKITSTLLFVPLVFGLFFAPPLSASTKDKDANRVHKEYYDNGRLRLYLRFKDDLIVRKRAYYRNGNLKADYQYKDGLAQKTRNFYETGELFSIWTRESNETKYYYRNGQLKSAVKAGDADPDKTIF